MQRRIYIIGFSIVAFSVLINLLNWIGFPNPFYVFNELARSFGTPIPIMILRKFPPPYIVAIVFYWCLVALVVRRILIMKKSGSISPPTSFTLVPFALMSLALACISLSVILIALAIVFGSGIGIMGVMAMIPATFILTPVWCWVEIRSLSFNRSQPDKTPM